MRSKSVVILVILLAIAAWWFLHENPEAEVREAHRELARLLSKEEGESSGNSIIDARVLQTLFAPSCEVTGDADMFAGSYTSEELVSIIFQVQAIFLAVELTFHGLEIEFPATDDAVGRFTAALVGRTSIEGEEEVAETRQVVSRMRNIEGNWLFTEFELAQLQNN